MHLSVNGQTVKIGQMGPDFLILDDAPELPPGPAEVTLSIDGRMQRWTVQLPHGVVAGKLKTPVSACRPLAQDHNAVS